MKKYRAKEILPYDEAGKEALVPGISGDFTDLVMDLFYEQDSLGEDFGKKISAVLAKMEFAYPNDHLKLTGLIADYIGSVQHLSAGHMKKILDAYNTLKNMKYQTGEKADRAFLTGSVVPAELSAGHDSWTQEWNEQTEHKTGIAVMPSFAEISKETSPAYWVPEWVMQSEIRGI